MKKLLILFILFTLSCHTVWSQGIQYVYNRDIQRDYIRTKTVWLIPSPFIFASYKFSPDYGDTWKPVGMFGEELKPYVKDNATALVELNKFTTSRVLGTVQLVASPVMFFTGIHLLSQYHDTGSSSASVDENTGDGFIVGGIISLFTGIITYHFTGRPALRRSMAAYYENLQGFCPEKNLPDLTLDYNVMAQAPVLSLKWTF